MSWANIPYPYQNDTVDTFSGTTLVARGDYYIESQILAIKVDTYYDLICEYDAWNCKIMYRIMECESQGNPNAHNFSHQTKDDSWGLFQINRYGKMAHRPDPEWLKVPENNIAYAYEIWKRQGYNAWKRCYSLTFF